MGIVTDSDVADSLELVEPANDLSCLLREDDLVALHSELPSLIVPFVLLLLRDIKHTLEKFQLG